MQPWEWEALPPPLQPPYHPAVLCAKRAQLLYEVAVLMVEDLPRDTPPATAITLAHLHGLAERLWALTRAEIEEPMDVGSEEEEW